MDIVFSRLGDNEARFVLEGVSDGFANSFRRAMMSEVPTLAIEDVRIYDNTSVLFDEILASRLGLIPIRTDLSTYRLPSRCECGGAGCPRCYTVYTLSVEGPCMVYSGDLVPRDPAASPVHDRIPILRLFENQKLVLEARAVLGKGKEHSKWQPTIACGYKHYPVITIDDRCDGCGMCVDECPRGRLANGKGKARVIPERLELCLLCRLCEKACKRGGIGSEPAIRVDEERSRYIFNVEGDGSLPVREIIKEALLHLKESTRSLLESLDEIAGGTSDEESE
ncbi:MAG: DNA-directed RNA polymerase subunit D [Methanomicrobiales archaeon]|nr:DNA-directed RNA polymerase subunit D [Methanomicrobiales archaeon]